jgi:NAD(P)-dependent dehydrogenase (short-subunit alcohol dehydrogenase family)
MKHLTGKTAFVTGGASGIGLGIAKAFAAAGMKLGIADIDDRALASATRLFEEMQVAVRAIKLDVRDRPAMDRAADEIERHLGPVDVLVNNAGVGDLAPLTELKMPQWDWVMSVNLDGVVNGVRAFLPRMLKRNSGHIVSTASDGVFLHLPNSGAYCVAKAGVIMLMELLRADLQGKEIGTTVLLPGLVRTNIVDNFLKLRPGDVPADARTQSIYKVLTGMLPQGMDPDLVGKKVLAAVKADRFWLFTHAAGREALEARHREMLAGLEAANESV